jgi:hypothetical protein
LSTFFHSGNLGDIVWSLPTIKALGGGDLYLAKGGIPAAIRKYNNGPVFPEYEGRLSQKDIDLITPLLESQPYINSVKVSNGDLTDYYDLDKFRGTVGQAFKTNFIETFAQTFNHTADYSPWLTVEPNRVAYYAVTRTQRYHSNKTSTIPNWLKLIRDNNLEKNGMFVGLPDEHKAFCELFDIKIPYYKCNDFLELAQVIAGAAAFFSNQTFAYGLACGLGKETVLETLSYRPLEQNECYIQRPNSHYF